MTYNQSADTRSLYIHWPFCPYKCHFCPFVALASHDQFMAQYHAALKKEIDLFGSQNTNPVRIDTIFLGGGTPSTYPDDLLLDMSGTLSKWFIFDDTTEFTIEVNPGTVRKEQLHVWKQAGINRLSIGVQSIKDDVLKGLNRHQSVADVHNLLHSASKSFDNISVDLILGLPGVTSQEWKELIQQVVTWPINHVSVYFLSVHEDTPLYFGVKAKRISLPADDEVVNLYCWTVEYLAEHGLQQYEISNFAREGYMSKHNSSYWDRTPYKGFGLGACSFDGSKRLQNQKNLMHYMQTQEQGQDATVFCEELTREQIHLEKIMLGLRRNQGVALKDLEQDLSQLERNKLNNTIGWLQENKLIKDNKDRLILTSAGLAIENEIVVKLSL